MGRIPRTIPHPKALVEITQRTLQGRFFFRPSAELRSVVVGVLARAQERTGVAVHGVAFLSNHYHLLITVDTTEQLVAFMQFVGTNLSKEIGALVDWPGSLFDGRYDSVPISREEPAQVARLRYLLSQGCKEGLVASPLDWPGVHSARASLEGRTMKGRWVDRSAFHLARARGRRIDGRRVRPDDFAEEVELELSPLPCWASLDAAEYRARQASMVREIEEETLARHRRDGTRPVGVGALRRRHPHFRSGLEAKRSRPRFHAWNPSERRRLHDGLREFVRAYRQAASELQRGNTRARFPPDCFPPGLPYRPPDPAASARFEEADAAGELRD